MARSHFVMRRLERRYGRHYIEAEYRKLKSVRHERWPDKPAMMARSA
jgi:hypothetical protein